MKQIVVKYADDCRKCGATINVGQHAVYERRVGIFCPACAPTDPEEIRQYRQEGADRKADKYDEWAEKRGVKAKAQLNSFPDIRHDIAFVTQPGRIPFRERMNQADERAYESLGKAKSMRQKAEGLRHVRVAGDAERTRQKRREAVLEWLRVGQKVDTIICGTGTVVKINRKTARVNGYRFSRPGGSNFDLAWLTKVAD